MKQNFFLGLVISLMLSGCVTSGSPSTGFFAYHKDASPTANRYEGETPKIELHDAKNSTIIIYSTGTRNSLRREDCSAIYNGVPSSVMALERAGNTYVYFLCSTATDSNAPGSYISKRANEIDIVLNEFLEIGVKPENIFLSGHSSGGWASLMSMNSVGSKFNAAIVFAPACCGKREDAAKYPIWRGKIRPAQVRKMLDVPKIEALVFAFKEDTHNRAQELRFLTDKFPKSVKLIDSECKGHLAHNSSCGMTENRILINEYVSERKKNYTTVSSNN